MSDPPASTPAAQGPLDPRRFTRLRALARLRRRAKWLVLGAPIVLVLLADARLRGDRLIGLSGKHVASYLFAIVESALLWGLLLYGASARRGAFRWIAALLFVALATFAVGGQLYFHRQYSTYLNLDATLFGTSFSSSLFGQLRADGKNFLTSVTPPLLLAIALVWAGRRVLRPGSSRSSRVARIALPTAIVAVFVIPCSYRTVQASTPDVIYFHALGGLIKQLVGVHTEAQVRPGLRTPPVLPLVRSRRPPVNVLFILTESVRADVACSAHVEDCPTTPETNAAAPERIPLLQMRSNSSTTAIELAVLWSGLEPIASREALHTAPLLFDYAHAGGWDVAYWTSHHMMFANSRLYVQDLPTSHQCGATDLDPVADIDLGARDELVTERAIHDLGEMKEPFFAVAHFGNTHVPYRVDPEDMPFQPALASKAPADTEAYRNYYKDAVHLQDKAIGGLIRFVKQSPLAGRTVIVFTSDHGEAFHDHGQLGHTGSILDEEVHVPAWIDAPPGALAPAEVAALRAASNAPAWHTDLTPTMLDVMGLWDEPLFAEHTKGLVGASLLRRRTEAPILAMSNCSAIWGCAFRNWGVMRGPLKLEGREWDDRWRCYDVSADPREEHDLGPEGCADLPAYAQKVYGGLPLAVSAAAGANVARHRRLRSRRRLIGLLVLLAPLLWVLATDLARRASLVVAFDRMHRYGWLASYAESAIVWGVLLYVASRRRGAVSQIAAGLFVILFGISMGVEAAFWSTYRIYLSVDGQIHSKSIPWSIVGSLPLSRPIVGFHLAGAFALAVLLVVVARRWVRPRRIPRALVPFLIPVVLVAPTQIPVSYRTLQSTSPDMIYFHGITGLVKEHLGITHDSPDLRVQRRAPEKVPPLTAKPARTRNVVLILQESQRFDVTCSEFDPDCELATRFSNLAAPQRMPLLQMRANDSTTAISISNIWTGVRPTESRALLHEVPLLWEYAHAAGWDTAYWTSQNLMFGNARLYVQDIPVSHRCVATELDTQADLDFGAYDRLLTDRVIQEWGELKEPFFAVIHYSNVHFPYVYDEANAPFQPASMDKSPEKNDEFKNYYKDVVYLSDIAVGRLLDHIRATESGQRTVIVYTSDHGESFREHWQLGHTSSIYDEEIHVPTWVDAPPGTLSPEEESAIRGAKDELLWHMDLAPTFLDLMGLWEDPAMAPFRARMIGHPITRAERTVEPVPLTNCTWVWECAFRNWGFMQGPLKLEAREWDNEYHCFNVLEDPDEQKNLGEHGCGPLAEIARQTFHVMPNVTPPGRPKVDWGK